MGIGVGVGIGVIVVNVKPVLAKVVPAALVEVALQAKASPLRFEGGLGPEGSTFCQSCPFAQAVVGVVVNLYHNQLDVPALPTRAVYLAAPGERSQTKIGFGEMFVAPLGGNIREKTPGLSTVEVTLGLTLILRPFCPFNVQEVSVPLPSITV